MSEVTPHFAAPPTLLHWSIFYTHHNLVVDYFILFIKHFLYVTTYYFSINLPCKVESALTGQSKFEIPIISIIWRRSRFEML